MSVSIEFGDERKGQPCVQVATNRGWVDVADWADELENETYPNLLHLIDHGSCDDLAGLIEDIDGALQNDEPDDETVAETLRGLRAAVKQNEGEPYVIVGDGFDSGLDHE